jgi:hypothetical protein
LNSNMTNCCRWAMTIPRTGCSAPSTSPPPGSRGRPCSRLRPKGWKCWPRRPSRMSPTCCGRPTWPSWRRSSTIRKVRTTTAMWLWRCSKMPSSPPRWNSPCARIPVPPSSWAKKGSRCGPASAMKKRSPEGVFNAYTNGNLRYSQNAPLTHV